MLYHGAGVPNSGVGTDLEDLKLAVCKSNPRIEVSSIIGLTPALRPYTPQTNSKDPIDSGLRTGGFKGYGTRLATCRIQYAIG